MKYHSRYPHISNPFIQNLKKLFEVYEALAYHVTQANFDRRVRTVGLWSLQKTIEAALSAMKTVMQPMSVYLQELQNADPLVEWGSLPT